MANIFSVTFQLTTTLLHFTLKFQSFFFAYRDNIEIINLIFKRLGFISLSILFATVVKSYSSELRNFTLLLKLTFISKG